MPSLSIISPNAPKWRAPSAGVFISLGSNLGFGHHSPQAVLLLAIERLKKGGDEVVATSSFWASDAWPVGTGAPGFINAVCQICPSDNDPATLMERLHLIEAEFGRRRDQLNRWSARTLDLDLLDYNGLVSENCSFPVLPHPRIEDRDFVLKPLLEVSPNWVHPNTQKTGQLLLDQVILSEKTNNCIQCNC